MFCADRELLSADSGADQSLEDWCTYVLTGVRDELKKVDRLAEYANLTAHILLPALDFARQRRLITPQEDSVLMLAVKGGIVKAVDLSAAMPKLNAAQRTYQIKKLVGAGMLQPVAQSARQYTIGFSHNVLLRGIIHALSVPAAVAGVRHGA